MSQENVEKVRRGIDAWNRGDRAEALAYYAPEAEWHTSGEFADHGVYRGHAGIERLWAELEEDMEELDLSVSDIRAVGDKVLVAGTMRGRGKQSKAGFEQPWWYVVTFRDGLTVRVGFRRRRRQLISRRGAWLGRQSSLAAPLQIGQSRLSQHRKDEARVASRRLQITSPSSKGARMATIHLKQTTTATPEQFVAALTDFGPGRSKLFGNTSDDILKVHDQGPGQADVTEGTRGIWERLRYDWSDPNRVVMTTTDSNVWGGDSGHTYTFTRKPNGTTDLDVVIVREGKNIKGRALAVVLAVAGKRVLGGELEKTVKAIEARNDGA